MSDLLHTGLRNLHRTAPNVESRSISSENFSGKKGAGGLATRGTGEDAARELGPSWKILPSVRVAPGETFGLCDIAGSGAIQHVWMTQNGHNHFNILRIYWDDSPTPAVECPVGDFFASVWGPFGQISSLAVCVNPGNAYNCYWPTPFRKRCRITMDNLSAEPMTLYYQIDYALGPVADDLSLGSSWLQRVTEMWTRFGSPPRSPASLRGFRRLSSCFSAW